jgi:putative tricarboxylic transport membrane protein
MSERAINRLSGLAVAVFGLLLLVWLIPVHVEEASYGWLRPQTLPQICAVGLIGLGLWLAARPGGAVQIDGTEAALCALVAGLAAGALWAMGRFGFLVTAPVFAALLVAIIGERRWYWALTGILGAPALIWLVVQVLLQRPLP